MRDAAKIEKKGDVRQPLLEALEAGKGLAYWHWARCLLWTDQPKTVKAAMGIAAHMRSSFVCWLLLSLGTSSAVHQPGTVLGSGNSKHMKAA